MTSATALVVIVYFTALSALRAQTADETPPRIIIAPVDQKVAENHIASFLCVATGSPAPEITWYTAKGRVTPKHPHYTVVPLPMGAMLRIGTAVPRRDNGVFHCRVKNGVGEGASASATLEVYSDGRVPAGIPRIIENPQPRSVEPDQSVSFSCGAVGNPGVTIKWFYNYLPVDLTDRRVKMLSSGALQIISAQQTDEGKYECSAENELGIAYSYIANLYIKVRIYMPRFSIPPEPVVEVIPGGDANITCVAVGSPMPYVKWRQGAQELTPEESVPIGRNVLQLHNIRESATYTCVASSDIGNIEAVAEVKVKPLPIPPKDVVARDVTSDSVFLYWTPSNDDPVESYIVRYRRRGDSANYAELTGITGLNQVVGELTPFTTYDLHVLSANSVGRSVPSVSVEIRTKEAAPSSAPRNIRARPSSATAVVVRWEEPTLPNGLITGYRVYYTLTPGLVTSSWNTLALGNVLTASLADFLTNRTYAVAVSASTVKGEGPISDPVQVRTQPGVLPVDNFLPEQPLNLAAEPLSDTSLRLTWDPPAGSAEVGGVESIESYEIYCVGAGRDVRATVLAPRRTHVIGGLAPSTAYVVRVAARSARGEGPGTAPVSVKTLDTFSTGPPIEVRGIAFDSTSLSISWSPPAGSGSLSPGSLAGYRLHYTIAAENRAIDDGSVSVVAVPAAERVCVVRGLRKWTEYRVWVRAYTHAGDGPASAPIVVQTLEDVPGEPRRVQLEAINSTAIRVQWGPPADQDLNGVIRGYQVFYFLFDDVEGATTPQTLETNESTLEAVLGGLSPDSQYQVQVAAYTRRGDGQRSRIRKVKTKSTQGVTPLGAPRSLRLQLTPADPPAVQVTWQAPLGGAGGRLNYKVEWGAEGSTAGGEQRVADTDRMTFTATDLDYSTEYEFRVSAQTPFGYGEEAVETIVTSEGVPTGAPADVTVDSTTSTTLRLIWSPVAPPQRRGVVTRYEISYAQLTPVTGPRVVNATGEWGVVEGLRAQSVYVVRVRGCTGAGCGPWGEEVEALTQGEGGVGPGGIVDETAESYAVQDLKAAQAGVNSVTLEWTPPQQYGLSFYRAEYHGYYVSSMKRSVNPVRGERNVSRTETSVTFDALQPNLTYTFSVTPKFQHGLSGPTKSVQLKPSGEGVVSALGGGEAGVSVAPEGGAGGGMLLLVLVPVCASIVALLLVVLIILCIRRRYCRPVKKVDRPQSKALLQLPVEVPADSNDPVELRRMNFHNQAMQLHPPIPVSDLAYHIDRLKASERAKFSLEYESIEPGQTFTWEASSLECNAEKNRYANVIAYDHSRVVLSGPDTAKNYINANFMDGYCRRGAYIATQGPLPSTIADFWQMVWEQYCPTIVMMTKLEERNRIKCDQYWPNRGSEVYGNVQVAIEDSMELATYTMRVFNITHIQTGESRKVHQFQFTAWPDHGVPDHPTPLLQFIRRVKTLTPHTEGPVVVHCSAGVGRTGAFIVIDAMLERLRHERTLDIYCHVTCLRAQRNYMVQTEDQYVFIHEALLEAVEGGDSEVPADSLYMHVQRLMQVDQQSCTELQLEFQRLTNKKPDPSRFVSASLPVNKTKNRLLNCLPYESTRVCLQMMRGVEGSDYINANYIDGYQCRRAYIATQGPLEDTVEDFWRMLWENNCSVVVMMTKLIEMGREKCYQYWPEERSAKYKYLVVDPVYQLKAALYIYREFKVTDARDGQSRVLRQFQFTDWPEQGIPNSGEGFIEFIGQVQKVRDQFGEDGPITVHCSMGVGRTGVFIALSIVLERMKCEGVIDMYQTVNMLRTQRPGMVQTEDQYAFCHRAALEYLSSFDHYGNSGALQ